MTTDEMTADLHAYIDGRLDDAGMERVERHLAANAAARDELRVYLAQKRDIATFADAAGGSVPDEQTTALAARLAQRLAPRRYLPRLRAAGIAVIWIAAGWTMSQVEVDWLSTPVFVDEAAEAHTALAGIVDPDDPRVDFRRLQLASAQLGIAPSPPDLSSFGLDLVALNIVPTDEGPALQYIYRGIEGGGLVSCFSIRGPGGKETPRVTHRDGLTLVYWGDTSTRHALVGTKGDEQMRQLAAAAHSGVRQL